MEQKRYGNGTGRNFDRDCRSLGPDFSGKNYGFHRCNFRWIGRKRILKIIKSRAGSTIVEAALVLPMLLIALAVILQFAIGQYETTSTSSLQHQLEREELLVDQVMHGKETSFIRSIDTAKLLLSKEQDEEGTEK